ncbi:MAG: hypothetical protein AABW91_01780 [Nanoarchaeota archaeon]
MSKTIERPTIAWIDGMQIPTGTHYYKQAVQEVGFNIKLFGDVSSALEKLQLQEYPFIFTEIELDPGRTNNPDIKRVIAQFDGEEPSKLLLPMIEYIRQTTGPNQASHIFVGGVYHPNFDALFLDISKRVKSAGATDYICFMDVSAFGFRDYIKDLAFKKV